MAPDRTPAEHLHERRLKALRGVCCLSEVADCLEILHAATVELGAGLLFSGDRDEIRRVRHLLLEALVVAGKGSRSMPPVAGER